MRMKRTTTPKDGEFFSRKSAANGSGATRRAEVPDRLGPRMTARPRRVFVSCLVVTFFLQMSLVGHGQLFGGRWRSRPNPKPDHKRPVIDDSVDRKSMPFIRQNRNKVADVYFIPGWNTNPPVWLKSALGNPTKEIAQQLRRAYPGARIHTELWNSFGTWNFARDNADAFGIELAIRMQRKSGDELKRTVLIGHSLGGRAVVRALKELDGKAQVHHAVLMGAAIKNNDDDLNTIGLELSGGTVGPVVNLFNVNDQILLYAFGTKEKADALGAFGVDQNAVKNSGIIELQEVFRAMAPQGVQRKSQNAPELLSHKMPGIEHFEDLLKNSLVVTDPNRYARPGTPQPVAAMPNREELKKYIKALWNAGTHDSRKYVNMYVEHMKKNQ